MVGDTLNVELNTPGMVIKGIITSHMNRAHHQYSARVARPEKSKAFLNPLFIASVNGIINLWYL